MSNFITNHPRGARGLFVEYSLGQPGLVVPFQFNPLQLQRTRALTFSAPGAPPKETADQAGGGDRLRALHRGQKDIGTLQEAQLIALQEEAISLEIRLDATDAIDAGSPLAAHYGIAPQLATLEQMVTPRDDTLLSEIVKRLPGASERFSYTQSPKPPPVLFVWGSRWALPVNIGSLTITESEFNLDLYPLRATVAVALTVIEGPNAPFKSSLRAREALAAQGAAVAVDVIDMFIPG